MRVIAGKYRGRLLRSLNGTDIRPTSDRLRETLFNVLTAGNPAALEGSVWLDLFAGTGAVVVASGTAILDGVDTYTGNTTLSAGITIDDATLTDAFGDGDLIIGAGAAGVMIDDTGIDTYSDERFFSYRRSVHRKEADYGRHVHAIVLEGGRS